MGAGEEEEAVVGRKLYGAVTLWQDWDSEAAESDPQYWELFTDLLLVAAASSMADAFKSNQSWEGFLEFVLLYSAIIHGWLLYTHHFTSRFLESSLVHSIILFFYLLGMAGTIVFASLETAQEFSKAVVLQRLSFLAMIGQVLLSLPRARHFTWTLAMIVMFTLMLFAIASFQASETYITVIWILAAIVDVCTEVLLLCFNQGQRLLPVNIEHSKDRLGVLALVMMGETVISATVAYREYVEEGIGSEQVRDLYAVLVCSFLVVFMFTLLYFHVQPRSEDHAFRRSRLTGMLCLALNKFLGMTLLMVGVCVKVAVDAAAEGEEISVFGRGLLNVSVGLSFLTLFGLRACHYAGKLPNESHPPHAKMIMWSWWGVFGVASICPFFFPQWDGQPIPPMAVAGGWLLILCVVETTFTHILDKHFAIEDKHGEHEPLKNTTEPSFYTGSGLQQGSIDK